MAVAVMAAMLRLHALPVLGRAHRLPRAIPVCVADSAKVVVADADGAVRLVLHALVAVVLAAITLNNIQALNVL